MDRADVIIFGGGLIGLGLASALDSSGVSAIVVDPADPAPRSQASFDGRTSAVSSSSMRMLETTGVAGYLAEAGCPIWRIAVADGLAPGGLDFEPDDHEPTDEPVDDPRADEPSGRPAKRKGRASVPSWDEIMFGGGKHD